MTTETKIYPITSIHFWRAYVVTMRPYLLFVSGAAGLVGLAFIREPSIVVLMLAFLPLFLSYGFGQALTDCFQTDTDALSSPYRPLVQGTVSRKQVLAVSLAGAAGGLLIMASLNIRIIALWVLAVIGLLTYTPLKRTWWGGPPWNSWIVALLPIMAYMTGGARLFWESDWSGDQVALAFLLAVATIFFAYANFVVMGYFKDITADKATGYRTAPVVFGWGKAAVLSDLTAALAIALAGATLLLLGDLSIPEIGVYAAAVVISLTAQIKLHWIRDEAEAHGPIGNVVRVFILLCLAIVMALQPGWLAFCAMYYLLFELTLKLRPEKSQV